MAEYSYLSGTWRTLFSHIKYIVQTCWLGTLRYFLCMQPSQKQMQTLLLENGGILTCSVMLGNHFRPTTLFVQKWKKKINYWTKYVTNVAWNLSNSHRGDYLLENFLSMFSYTLCLTLGHIVRVLNQFLKNVDKSKLTNTIYRKGCTIAMHRTRCCKLYTSPCLNMYVKTTFVRKFT